MAPTRPPGDGVSRRKYYIKKRRENTRRFWCVESDELPPEAVGVPRREDRNLAVDEELHALDWTLPILHDDAMTVDADAALLRRLKVIPVLPLAPAKVL